MVLHFTSLVCQDRQGSMADWRLPRAADNMQLNALSQEVKLHGLTSGPYGLAFTIAVWLLLAVFVRPALKLGLPEL